MKKLLMLPIFLLSVIMLVGCSSEETSSEVSETNEEVEKDQEQSEQQENKEEAQEKQDQREADKAQQEVLATVPLETQYGVGTYVVGEDIPAGDYWITPTIEEDLHKTSCEINYGGDSDTVVNMNVTNQMIELDNGDVVTITENCYIELREHAL